MAVREAPYAGTPAGTLETAAENSAPLIGRRWTDDEWSPRHEDERGGAGLARFLGWFSVALGVAELAAPRRVARLIGVDYDEDNRRLLQTLGLRELATGIGILAQPQEPAWMWARVGGDMMDLTLLGSALKSDRSDHGRVTAATAAVLGVTALDVLTGQRLSAGRNGGGTAERGSEPRGTLVRRTITVRQTPAEVYGFWRDLRNLPRLMEHLESVEPLEGNRSRWRARAPVGTTVEWEAEIVEDRPGELISWRSVEGSEVDNLGTVRFTPAPGDQGTEIQVELRYDPPAGKLGAVVAKLTGQAPEQQVASDLRRLKQVLETGEAVRSDASVHRMPHPARPPEPGELPSSQP